MRVRPWLGGIGLALISVLLTPVGQARAAVTFSAPSYVTLVSQPGDQSGASHAGLWRSGPQQVSVAGSPPFNASITVEASDPGGGNIRIEFDPPVRKELHSGSQYQNAKATPTPDFGALRITRDGQDTCAESRGWFEVKEKYRDLSRLWILYQQECLTTGETLFGEVRVGDTTTAYSSVVGLPAVVRWPSAEEGPGPTEVPVTFLNAGAEPVEVTGVKVMGNQYFSVVQHDCATLAPNATCTATVSFTPGDAHSAAAVYDHLDIVGADGRGLARTELEGMSHRGINGLDLSSQRGDWVGDGSLWSYRPQDAIFNYDSLGDESRVEVLLFAGTKFWSAEFLTGGGSLTPGTTYEVDGRRSNGPSLDVSGDSRGCGLTTGEFTVQEARFDGSQQLTAFAATFRQHCEGTPATLTGAVAFGAQRMPEVPDPLPVGPVWELSTSPDLYSTLVTWTNPAVDTWTDTVVRMRRGPTAPATVTDGTPVYQGRGSGVLVRRLDPGIDYTFAVFARDPDGVPSSPRTVTVQGTHLSLTAPRRLSRGDDIRLTARLTSASGAPVKHQYVYTFWRNGRTGDWKGHIIRRTDEHGRIRFPGQIATRTGQYRAVYWGGPRRFGDTAGPVTVRVTP